MALELDLLGAQRGPFGPLMCVNVGGKVFTTSATKLRKAPFFDSMLTHAEEGRLGLTLDDAGNPFVDRSGYLFGYILGYLSSGRWVLQEHASDHEFVEALRQEATFYGLEQAATDRMPPPAYPEYVTVWKFHQDTTVYVDCLASIIREEVSGPNEDLVTPGAFRLCKYSGNLPLDQRTAMKRFKAIAHTLETVDAYFTARGFGLIQVVRDSMMTHTTSIDGQTRCARGMMHILTRQMDFSQRADVDCDAPPNTQRS